MDWSFVIVTLSLEGFGVTMLVLIILALIIWGIGLGIQKLPEKYKS
ncbi:MAG: hypothetical protein J7J88_00620 [Dehalococcoidia bacterium]|nr:hypothetical protein [Dehalococcoidia bacterium]